MAASGDEFKSRLGDREFVSEYFGVDMVADLLRSNCKPGASQIYSFKVPPILGGAQSIENVEATDIEVHFSLAGQIHRQVKDLPAGTAIESIEFEQ